MPSRSASAYGSRLGGRSAALAGTTAELCARSAKNEGGKRLRRGLRATLIAGSLGVVCLLAAFALWIASLGPPPLGAGLAFSTLVVDRDGRLLRPYTTDQGRWRLPATRENVDPRFFKFLFAYEDKRFLEHHGVDPLALGRAFGQLMRNGHIVSGASTLSMQVARLLEPRSERSFMAKLRQMVRAIEIEHELSKDQILALYLSLAPYGGNLEGIRAASLAYFGKEPRRLTLAESALLVALPQSPEQRRPDRARAAAHDARDRVLDRFAAAGLVPADEVAAAKREPVPDGRVADADAGAAFRRRGGGGRARPQPASADHRRHAAEESRGAGARARARAGRQSVGRHPGGRSGHRRGAGPRRLGGLFRCRPRRRRST